MLNKFIASAFLIVNSISIGATALSECLDLNISTLSLSLHAFNIANANTTRTPDGGAFKRREVTRKNKDSVLEVVEVADYKMVYEPSHPDANSEGMVTYPNIDVEKKRVGASAAATQLRLLARNRVCGAIVKEDGFSAYVRYDKIRDKHAPDIFSDTVIFGTDNTLTVWTRRLLDGTEQTFRF